VGGKVFPHIAKPVGMGKLCPEKRILINVLIYFDTASKRRVLDHFFNSLLPHGYVFLGQSESMFGITDVFRLVHLPASTAYLKAEHRKANGV
jgi:CheR methyltransferase-like protein